MIVDELAEVAIRFIYLEVLMGHEATLLKIKSIKKEGK
jgi:hypothetical protein